MLGDLSTDLIGTNPKYPKIVNHGWLDVDPATYDNYPSNNERLRVLPQIAKQWGHENNSGINLIPNLRIMPLTGAEKVDVKDDVIRSAKKAAMSGLTGNKISEYLKARFSKNDIEACSEDLSRISSEQGLLGNVYADASAFSTAEEASSFLRNNTCRLAKYVVVGSHQNMSAMEYIFKKKAVSEMSYDTDLFNFYKAHLVAADRIPSDFVIDSKESLRKAFLFKKEKKVEAVEHKEQKPIDFSEVSSDMAKRSETRLAESLEAQDAIRFHLAKPVVAFAQELLHMGKTRGYVKEALRNKYSTEDLSGASNYLAIVASEKGLTLAHLKELHQGGKIASMLAYHELEEIARKYPVTARQEILPEESKFGRQVGVRGYFYTPKSESLSDKWASEREHAVSAIKHGFEVEKVKAKLLEKMSEEEACTVLSESISLVNASGFSKANPKKKAEKIIVEDKPRRSNAQTPDQMIQENSSIQSFFQGASDEIPVDPSNRESSIDMGVSFSMDGLDGELE